MILLLHGFNCDPSVWDGVIPEIAGRDMVVAPYLPWHRDGENDGAEPTVEGLAQAVAGRHLRAEEPAVVVGHSLGGMVALHLAHLYPDMLTGLVLVDAFPSLELNRRVLPDMYGPETSPEVAARAGAMMSRGRERMNPNAHARIWASIESMDASPWLGDLRLPLLGVYGGRGRRDADEVKRLLGLDRVPEAQVVLAPKSGHFVMWEDPATLLAALKPFLASLAPC